MSKKNKQIDLFLTSIVDAPVKDQRDLMEFPHFSLQKQPRREPFIYEDVERGVRIEIQPGAKGMATIWDKDILIYCASLLNEQIEAGQTPERTFHFAAYDFLRLTGRGTGKQAYDLLKASLARLLSTTITTTIKSGGTEEITGFPWIENYKIVRKTKGDSQVMAAIRVTMNEWLFRALVQDRAVLTINSDYFAIKSGLERRLYELARKHCGRQQSWIISLEKLRQRCGLSSIMRKFKFDIKRIIELDSLLDYQMSLSFDSESRPKRSDLPASVTRRYGSNERILVTFFPRHGHVGGNRYIEND